MSFLDKLERRFGRFAVPHVTVALIACQVVVFLANLATVGGAKPIQPILELVPERVLYGEVWRLVTFLAVPPPIHPVFLLCFIYLYYLMGTALERTWGVFRYNVYLLIGYVATVAVAFILPEQPAKNAYLLGSVYLAFAYLFPDFELYVFFLLPVKIKWLALLTWLFYGWTVVFGSWDNRLMVLASVGNFLLFFGKDIAQQVRTAHRRMGIRAASLSTRKPAYYHRCTVCGITDRTDPQMEFRYCSKCAGDRAYCMDHLRSHDHVAAPETSQTRDR
jgi:membrane associated rhomboid family serine protease